MEVSRALLGTVDYIIFGTMLLISAGIGVYFRFSGGKQKTADEYLLAGKDMSILPVAFSLMASFLSAITLLGVPAETYRYGVHLVYMNIGYALGMVITSYVSLPVFFEFNASTAYEYLEKRFGKFARTISSMAFVLQMILYMSVVLYAPALALSAVTNMSIWISVVSIGTVCTFYCTLGGMKAVLWTDVFQAVLMFLGIFAVLIKGSIDMGIGEIYQKAYDGGRLAFPGFNLDLTTRYTIWNVIIHGIVFSMSQFGGNQVQVQRLLTVKNLSRSKLALFVSIPMGVSFHVLTCLAGIVMYAYYADCDPMTAPDSHLTSSDQLLPYYIMSSLGKYPGLPGLCICGVFSASLSTVSSAVNSLTAVTMQDLIRPILESKGISEKKLAFSAKAITLFYGFLCIALTFVAASFGNLIQAGLTVLGILGGPVLAVFILGMLTSRANEKGVVIGLVTAIGISAWISFGATANGPPPKWLPVSLEGCSAVNSSLDELSSLLNVTTPSSLVSLVSHTESTLLNTTFQAEMANEDYVFPLYRISYMWYPPIGFLLALIVGYLSSLVINTINGETLDVPEELLSPVFKYFMNRKSYTVEEKGVKISVPMVLQNAKEKTASNGIADAKVKENERY